MEKPPTTLVFEPTSKEHAEFTIPAPVKWGENSVTFIVNWIRCDHRLDANPATDKDG